MRVTTKLNVLTASKMSEYAKLVFGSRLLLDLWETGRLAVV